MQWGKVGQRQRTESMKEGEQTHWFEPIADHLSDAYLRYSFTYGTKNEVECLMELLDLKEGDSLLDVGCGPGRHSNLFAEKGLNVTGIDISKEFIRIADTGGKGAEFIRQDVRQMDYESEFDAVISMCQGGFGLLYDPTSSNKDSDMDMKALENMSRALKPGGKLALSAFSAYFQVRFLDEKDFFNAFNGVNKEEIEIISPEGLKKDAVTWTTCFTPRELRFMVKNVGLTVKDIWSVTPLDYELLPCGIENPEFLLLAEKQLA